MDDENEPTEPEKGVINKLYYIICQNLQTNRSTRAMLSSARKMMIEDLVAQKEERDT